MPRSQWSSRERNADEVSVAPYQATFADSPKIIERQIELDWQDVQVFQANARAGIRHVAHTTRKYIGLATEE
jgi:hypothetical protein